MENEKKKYVFIIVDFFSADNTIKFMDHIHTKVTHLQNDVAFVVVDNSNNTCNLNKLKSSIVLDNNCICNEKNVFIGTYNKYPTAIVFASDNLGYAKGNNLGTQIANILFHPKYLIISNNDIICLDKTLKLEKMDQLCQQDPTIAVVGPNIIGTDGKNQSPCKEMDIYTRWIRMSVFYPFNHLFGFSSDDLIKNAKTGFTYRIMGSFMFIENEHFNKIGGFDEQTFLYSEESILAEKMKRINKRVYYFPEITLLHKHSTVIGKSYNSFKRTELMFESEMVYFKKYKGASNFSLFLARFAFKLFKVKYIIMVLLRLQK